VSGLFDQRVSKLDSDDVVALAIELADVGSDDRRITSVNAGVSSGVCAAALANSRGFSATQRFTSFDIGAEIVARSASVMFSGVDSEGSRRFDRKAIGRIGASARDHALMGLEQKTIRTGDYPVVLDPVALGFVLSSAVGSGANAEGIQRKRSYLAGKLGEPIGNERFTVFDDPTIEWGSGSFSFDGEGVPGERKTVIERGRLRSYLYDSYTAGKDGVESTGNSSRGGSMWSFRAPPAISSSNLVVKKGDSRLSEMIEETKKGVYLRITYDYPNLATGEFSALMMESYEISGGELGPALKQSTMGITLFDLMGRLDMVGRDSRDVFGVRTPSVRISKARIAGSA
jgi:PmbA protein